MTDWRQIQARIRKAKNSPDAVSKLSELFKRTRDGMVAWELGAIEEKADHRDEAGHWYTIAAQRFRRADWRKKAEEALTRLGIPLPPQAEVSAAAHDEPSESSGEISQAESGEEQPSSEAAEVSEEADTVSASSESSQASAEGGAPGEQGHRRRRRGRRGGRGRKRKGAGGASGLPTQAFAERPAQAPSQREAGASPVVERRAFDRVETEPPSREHLRTAEMPPPQLPSERVAHGRSDPAVASRMAHLESLLRRLLGSPLHKLDEADEAPAGPGVFLLSESDQTASYYVEACQTLRVGLANLTRGGRGGKGGRGRGPSEENLKAKLAENLGINEAKVSQYLKDHCCVRWIQSDDDAPLLAHFAIAVLRTPLNLD